MIKMVYGKDYGIIVNFREFDEEETFEKELIKLCNKHKAILTPNASRKRSKLVINKNSLVEYLNKRREDIGISNPGILGQQKSQDPNKKHIYGRLAELDKLENFICLYE